MRGRTVCVPDADFADSLRTAVPDVEVLAWDGHAPPPAGLERVDLVVPPYPTADWDGSQFARLPGLSVVQLLSAGYDPWIAILPTRTTLCSGQGVHGSSTAELAVTGLLAQWHHLPALVEQQRRHEWRKLQGETASGKRVLVVGAGDIGSRAAEVLRVLGADVTVLARTPRPGVEAVDALPELCRHADALVLAVPLSADTTGLVDGPLLAHLPDGAVVVNVARGPVVDTAALLRELSAGRLRAVLDVTDPEPLPPGSELWDAPGLLLTPHVGGGAEGWRRRAEQLVEDQVQRLTTGAPLRNVVVAGAEPAGANP